MEFGINIANINIWSYLGMEVEVNYIVLSLLVKYNKRITTTKVT